MKFTKMHGIGNDYVYVNAFEELVADPAAVSIAISDRHEGIGSDGLILICPSDRAEARMEMYNADGSRGRMCGNGIRCVAKYLVDHGLASGPEVRIDTDAGLKTAICTKTGDRVTAVRIDMGVPRISAAELPSTLKGDRLVDYPIEILGESYKMTCVSMGNPHAVVYVDDLEGFDLARVGPAFEHHRYFPERINLHVVRVDRPNNVAMRTWERGSGMTRACGTGACAVCVAGVLTGRSNRLVTARLPGGELLLEWPENGPVFKTGPAVEVFTGVWESPR